MDFKLVGQASELAQQLRRLAENHHDCAALEFDAPFHISDNSWDRAQVAAQEAVRMGIDEEYSATVKALGKLGVKGIPTLEKLVSEVVEKRKASL